MGPVPAGKDAPLSTLALGEAGALVHVDKWQSTIGGGGSGQAGTHGDTQGLKMQIKGRINKIRTVEST